MTTTIDIYDGKSIRAALKAELGYNARQVSVRLDNYSMGHSVNFTIRDPSVDRAAVERWAAENVERISRCEITGEILSGGNTYVHVTITGEVAEAWAEPWVKLIRKAAEETGAMTRADEGMGSGVQLGDTPIIFMRDAMNKYHSYLYRHDLDIDYRCPYHDVTNEHGLRSLAVYAHELASRKTEGNDR